MFYEGTEKRLLLATKEVNLLALDELFWQTLVTHSGAEILSCIENTDIKAYLLSESSLFVWKNKLLLITCGNTQLVKAALFLQQELTKEKISTLIFQRHQALKPECQSSNFEQDSLLLKRYFNGHQQHWNDNYQGDLFVFGECSDKTIITQNIYMFHGLQSDFSCSLQNKHVPKEQILSAIKIDDFFEGLTIDHFSFKPKGYSLNAIRDQDYLTIHLTPEKLSTYISIESSYSDQDCAAFITHLKQLFLPSREKRMHFQTASNNLKIDIF